MTSRPEDIIKTLDQLAGNREAIEDQVFDVVLFTPSGGITLDEAWHLSFQQRNKLIKKINKYNKEKIPKEQRTEYLVDNR